MEQDLNSEVRRTTELFRPREIVSDPSNLRPVVGLFGTCGSPASTWRQDIFIPELKKRGLSYFNPQLDSTEWLPEMALEEADHMANDAVIVLPISQETHGYGSLGEAGWAMLSAMLRGQKLGIFVEENENMPENAKRTRTLFREFAKQLQRGYPVFQFEDSMQDLAHWGAITMKDREDIRNSHIKDSRTIILPKDIEVENLVGIFGTSSSHSVWKKNIKKAFDTRGVAYFDPYKDDWSESNIAIELDHKTKDSVLLQVITGETESFGSIAESGLLALSAFVRGQAYGLYIEDHPSDSKSDTNRARTLVKAHVKKLNEQFPGLVFHAESIDELQEWAIKTVKTQESLISRSRDEVRCKIEKV